MVSGCGCSTAAAARSAAAADRAMRRSSPSRRARYRVRSALPSRARSSPASIRTRNSAAAISKPWPRPRSKRACCRPRPTMPRPEFLDAMDHLSAAAYRAYRSLVYETEGFDQFLRESTVIGEIANLNIGSRPSSRSASARIEDLRAIPWVFSWAQCRLMLPGWYGFGSAVEDWLAAEPATGMAMLQRMHRDWPFLPDAAVEHGDGAGEERYRDRLALCPTRRRSDIARAHLRPPARRMAQHRRRRADDQSPGKPARS